MTERDDTLRSGGVTGSEIAAVAGLSPWRTPLEVWLTKTGQAEPQPDNPDMERGRRLEPALRDWLADRRGYQIRLPGTLRDPEHELVIATPDGAAYRDGVLEAAVEIKAPRTSRDWEDPDQVPDGIPIHILPQVIWEMRVLQVHVADVAALLDGQLRVYRVAYDDQLFHMLLARAKAFWRYVELREPPPLDGSDAAREYLTRRYPRPTADIRPASLRAEELAHELRRLESAQKKTDAEIERLRNLLRLEIGDAEGIRGTFGTITWRARKDSETIDVKRLRTECPDVAEKYSITRPGGRVFLARWADDQEQK